MQYSAGRGYLLSRVHQTVVSHRMMSFNSAFSRRMRNVFTLQHKLLSTASRLFFREMPRAHLDAENLSALIRKDITVFTYRNSRFFLLMTIFGGLQFVFWANLAIFINSDPTVEHQQKQLQKTDNSWMGSFYAENRSKIAATCLSLGMLVICNMLCF